MNTTKFLLWTCSSPMTMLTALILAGLVGFTVAPFAPNLLNGGHLRFDAFHFPPWGIYTPGPNGTYTWTGSTPECIRWLAAACNMTFTVIPTPVEQIKKLGAIKAAINQLLTDQIDLCTYAIGPTPELMKAIDFSYPVNFEPWRFIVEKPGEESRLFAFIRPFQPMVWYAFFITTAGMVVFMASFSWFYMRSGEGGQTRIDGFSDHDDATMKKGRAVEFVQYFNDYSFYLINVVTNHGSSLLSAHNSFRILVGLWLLAATVLVNSYSGILTSSLTVPVMKPGINNFDDLAASDSVLLSINPDSQIGVKIMTADSGVFKALGDQVRRHQNVTLYRTIVDESFFKPGNERAYPVPESFSSFMVGTFYKKERTCRLMHSDILPYVNMFFYGLPKNGRYNQLLSEKYMKLWETGLVFYWLRNLTPPEANKCFIKENESARQKPIKLVDLTSAFFILGIGVGLSVVCFVCELLLTKLRKRSPTISIVSNSSRQ